MGDHMKHKAFELADEVAVLFYRLTVGSDGRLGWFDFSNEAGSSFDSF